MRERLSRLRTQLSPLCLPSCPSPPRCWMTRATQLCIFCMPTPESGEQGSAHAHRIQNLLKTRTTIPTSETYTSLLLLSHLSCCRSIARRAQLTADQIKMAAQSTTIVLEHEKELKLGKALIRFPEVICRVLDDLTPHTLCDYAYDLCTTFTEFYDNCYCIEKRPGSDEIVSVNMSRILLCEATAAVLGQAFHILGLQPLDRM